MLSLFLFMGKLFFEHFSLEVKGIKYMTFHVR
jgi:hypothetical protein